MSENSSNAGNVCFLALAIVAVIVASEYNEKAACGTEEPEGGYTIDLVMYLNVAGFTMIAWFGFICMFNCGLAIFFSDDLETKATCKQFLLIPALCLIIWNIVWSSIGLSMYVNEMSDACKDTTIANMILSWGIIQIVTLGCAVCMIIIFVVAKAAS